MTITNLRPGARRNSLRPDPQFDNVVLLAPFDGTDGDTTTTDLSNNAHAITLNGSAALDGSARKYGFTSLACDGAATFSAQALVDAGMASGDFTIEFWYRPDGTASVDDRIFQTRDGDVVNGIYIAHESTNADQIRFGYDINGSSGWDFLSTGANLTNNEWQHVALVRNGSAWNLYLDGISVLSTTYAGSVYLVGGDTCVIGAQTVGSARANGGNIEQFRISSVARYTGAFTPPARAFPARRNFIDPDPYFDSVVLLSKFNGKDGDTTTVDSSNYNQTITGLNNVSLENTQTNFNSNTSGYFSGTGINNGWKVTTVSDSFDLSTVDFTIECWLYITTHNATNTILTTGPVSVDIRNLSRQLRWDYYPSGGGADVNSTSTVVPLNQWNHIAVVRDGINLHGYLNGVVSWSEVLSVPDRTLRTLTDAYMGISSDSGVSNDGLENAYMEDFRVTKGVCRYPGGATFNVPVETFSTTAPVPGLAPPNLPQADPYFDSVSLLVPFSGDDGDTTATDLSSSAHTLTFAGNAALESDIRKYGFTSLYVPATGSNSYVDTNSTADLALGTGDFTIEFLVNFESFAGPGVWQGLFDQRTTPTQVRPAIYISSTETLNYYVNGVVRIVGPTTASLSTDTWYHIAVCRSSTTTKMFVDGIQVGSDYTDTNDYTQERIRLGGLGNDTSYPARGYIENVRVTKGVARYKANFAPPARAFPTIKEVFLRPDWNNVVLLAPFDGADAATTYTSVDKYTRTAVFDGNTELDTAQSKFGTASLYSPGLLGDRVRFPDTDNLSFGANAFTIECWVRFSSIQVDTSFFVSKWTTVTPGADYEWAIGFDSTDEFRLWVSEDGTSVITKCAWANTPSLNTWIHVAATYDGTTYRLFVDGILRDSDVSSSTLHSGNSDVTIADRVDGQLEFHGWIDDVRVVSGEAVYVKNFTPPTEAFPTS